MDVDLKKKVAEIYDRKAQESSELKTFEQLFILVHKDWICYGMKNNDSSWI